MPLRSRSGKVSTNSLCSVKGHFFDPAETERWKPARRITWAEAAGRRRRARFHFTMESLILAQNERWRRGLGMQVERESGSSSFRTRTSGGKRRKGEYNMDNPSPRWA